jgi:hypothetical protein
LKIRTRRVFDRPDFLGSMRRWMALPGCFLFFGLVPLLGDAGLGLNAKFGGATPAGVRIELATLRSGRLLYLREDLPSVSGWPVREALFQRLDRAGYKIVGLVPYGIGPSSGPTIPTEEPDLRDIYRRAKALARCEGGAVAVWELYNEPDAGFCPELPDRFSAEAKATYLGLKAASPHPVLLPSLGLPPGPWLERAAANGLLDYGDAFNLHYYGFARDFPDLLALTRHFLRRQGAEDGKLPLWITEIGIRIPDDAPDPAAERERQAGFFHETLRTAAENPQVAAYLTYAFRDGAYSLADAAGTPYPALTEYLQASRTQTFRAGPAWLDRAKEASPVVLEWAPGNCLPDKISGDYVFSGTVMNGTVRIYNLSPRAMTGTLGFDGLSPAIRAEIRRGILGRELTLPAWGRLEVPVRFTPLARGYRRETARFTWYDAATGAASPLSFGVATLWRLIDHTPEPIAAVRPDAAPGAFHWIDTPRPYEVTDACGPWLALNGLKVRTLEGSPDPEKSGDLSNGLFSLDPTYESSEPPMAIARVDGLPASDFLRLRTSGILGKEFSVRVDLIDERGERFTVFEHGAHNPGHPRKLWLNWQDFQLYFWGHYPHRLHPLDLGSVCEVQLRFQFQKTAQPIRVRLDAMRPREF